MNNMFDKVTVGETIGASHHGLSPAKQKVLRAEKGGYCDICGIHEDEKTRQHAIDHCHTTGAIRGLLCHSCNVGIGYFKDDPTLLESAINYIKEMTWQN
jgi:hypothetical protein